MYEERVTLAMELLKGKWTVQILCAMRKEPVRLSQLRRLMPSASKKGLTASLRELERARIVIRQDLSHSVLHVEYELAPNMLDPILALLDRLAECGQIYETLRR